MRVPAWRGGLLSSVKASEGSPVGGVLGDPVRFVWSTEGGRVDGRNIQSEGDHEVMVAASSLEKEEDFPPPAREAPR